MPSCIAPCDINYCNAMASNPRLFLLLGNARYDGMHEVRALVNKCMQAMHASICMQASQCIVSHHGSIRDVLHACACVGTMHTQACMHATHTRAHVCTRMQMHAKIVRNIMDFSLFSRNTLPPTKYRNPKTEHRIEIYLNISDYM